MENFTVLMPIYDREDIFLLFDRAIESCLSNSVLPDEILIIVVLSLNNLFSSGIFKSEYKGRSNRNVLKSSNLERVVRFSTGKIADEKILYFRS